VPDQPVIGKNADFGTKDKMFGAEQVGGVFLSGTDMTIQCSTPPKVIPGLPYALIQADSSHGGTVWTLPLSSVTASRPSNSPTIVRDFDPFRLFSPTALDHVWAGRGLARVTSPGAPSARTASGHSSHRPAAT